MDIVSAFSDFRFEPGPGNVWLPLERTIMYNEAALATNRGRLGLLHEVCHGLLGHRYYSYDLELLLMEQTAWVKTAELAKQFGIRLDKPHVQRCLKSYETWLEQRATCPNCRAFGLQLRRNRFVCIECSDHWQTNDRKTARVHRRRIT